MTLTKGLLKIMGVKLSYPNGEMPMPRFVPTIPTIVEDALNYVKEERRKAEESNYSEDISII